MKFPCFVLGSDNMCGDCSSYCINLRCSEIRALQGLMSGDSGVWATAIVEFLLKQLAVFFFINDRCIYTSEDVIDWSC